MNYEEKYNEALKVIEGLYNVVRYQSSTDALLASQTIEKAFPELAEPEDERIRKAIVKMISDIDGGFSFEKYGIIKKEALAWLEKQGEQKPTPKFKIGDTIHKIGENTVFPRTIEKIEDGDYVCNNSHSFVSIEFQDDYELVEQKTAEAKPKFKVGDWITDGEYTWKVTDVDRLDYTLQSQNGDVVDDAIFYVDEEFHLWTIQDAKDGDVLAIDWKDEWEWQKIVIFKSLGEDGVEGYGNTFKNNKLAFKEDVPFYSKTWTKNLHPATKEQRDLLFQKMKEVGYEWDAEKKKLKKIYQEYPLTPSECFKPAWSEEDEKMLKSCITILEQTSDVRNEWPLNKPEVDWLKSLKPRWKPSEEQMEGM